MGDSNTQNRQTVKRRWELVFGLLFILCAYLLIGGAVMYALEHDVEVTHLEDAAKEIELLRSGNVTLDDYHMGKLEEDGVCKFPRNDTDPHWTFTGATFFSMTVITTIGFGSFAPATWRGRSFTAFYAIVGISIFGQLMTETAEVLVSLARSVLGRCGVKSRKWQADDSQLHPTFRCPEAWAASYDSMREKYGSAAASFPAFVAECLGRTDPMDDLVLEHCLHTAEPTNRGSLSEAEFVRAVVEWIRVDAELPHVGTGKSFLAAVGWALMWCLIWSAVFSSLEGWTIRESLWFCLVAMTTIGFGDYTPEHTSGRIACFVFVLPGISLTGACFGAIWAMVRTKRFWFLQGLHERGVVTEKLLQAFGIRIVINKDRGVRQLYPPGHASGSGTVQQGQQQGPTRQPTTSSASAGRDRAVSATIGSNDPERELLHPHGGSPGNTLSGDAAVIAQQLSVEVHDTGQHHAHQGGIGDGFGRLSSAGVLRAAQRSQRHPAPAHHIRSPVRRLHHHPSNQHNNSHHNQAVHHHPPTWGGHSPHHRPEHPTAPPHRRGSSRPSDAGFHGQRPAYSDSDSEEELLPGGTGTQGSGLNSRKGHRPPHAAGDEQPTVVFAGTLCKIGEAGLHSVGSRGSRGSRGSHGPGGRAGRGSYALPPLPRLPEPGEDAHEGTHTPSREAQPGFWWGSGDPPQSPDSRGRRRVAELSVSPHSPAPPAERRGGSPMAESPLSSVKTRSMRHMHRPEDDEARHAPDPVPSPEPHPMQPVKMRSVRLMHRADDEDFGSTWGSTHRRSRPAGSRHDPDDHADHGRT